MIKKNFIPIVAIAFAIIVAGVVFFLQKGVVSVEIADKSPIQDGVKISFSKGNFQSEYEVPMEISLRPGSYQYVAFAVGAESVSGDITIKPDRQVLKLNLPKSSENVNLTDRNLDSGDLSQISDLHLFPYLTDDYTLEAVIDRSGLSIKHLQLVVYHHFSVEFAEEDRQLAKKSAEKWLESQGLKGKYEIKIVDGN